MSFVRVKNWRKRQSYEGRVPQWIKLFRDLLNPVKQPEYAALSDTAKLHLLHIWMLAAGSEGDIPTGWLNQAQLNIKSAPRLKELYAGGFITRHDVGFSLVMTKANSASCPSDSVSDSDSFDQEQVFSEIWRETIALQVPKPLHKATALRHFAASVKSQADADSLRRALTNYRASRRVSSGFVQDAGTFFKNWGDWVDYTEKETARVAVGMTEAEWDNLHGYADPPWPYGMPESEYEELKRKTYPDMYAEAEA